MWMMLFAMLTTVSSADVLEDFVRSANSNIDSAVETNETPRQMEGTGFTWGALDTFTKLILSPAFTSLPASCKISAAFTC